MVSSDSNRNRKEKTLKAHRILLELDEQDFGGSVTFHFKRGQGIVTKEIRDIEHWNGTVSENKVIAFSQNI